jgi:putative transposase
MMGNEKALAGRKRPAHHPVIEQNNRSIIVFVTVCSKNRTPIFTKPETHNLLIRSWEKADRWIVGRYVIMPDHIHFFCSPVGLGFPELKKWIQYWKALVSREWPHPDEQPIWQQDFWDTQLRQRESYSEKWHYVRNNPVRENLVERVEDWPFQGEIEPLLWHN